MACALGLHVSCPSAPLALDAVPLIKFLTRTISSHPHLPPADEPLPLILIGPGRTLRLRNLRLVNAASLAVCLQLAPGELAGWFVGLARLCMLYADAPFC